MAVLIIVGAATEGRPYTVESFAGVSKNSLDQDISQGFSWVFNANLPGICQAQALP